jgi:hypothetical protein
MMNPAIIAGFPAGAAVLIVGTGAIALRRRSRRIDRGLRDADPAVRLAAISSVADRGMSSHLNALVELALVEKDPKVKEEFARKLLDGSGSRTDRRLVELREWATRSLAEERADNEGETPRSVTSPGDVEDGNSHSEIEVTESGDGSDNATNADSLVRPEEDLEGIVAESQPSPSLEAAAVAPSIEDVVSGPQTWSNGIGSPGAKTPLEKTQENAVELLRAAGYGMARPVSSDSVGRIAHDERDASDDDELSELTELCVRRVISVTMLEEAARRMREDNASLEAVLTRLLARQRRTEGSQGNTVVGHLD